MFLAALSALLWDFLFIPPRFTFYISRLHDFMMFGAYFVVAIVIGHFAARLREREQAERRREERATALVPPDTRSGRRVVISMQR